MQLGSAPDPLSWATFPFPTCSESSQLYPLENCLRLMGATAMEMCATPHPGTATANG